MDIPNNTIDRIKISIPEFVIIKDLEKEYQKIKIMLIEEIYNEILIENENIKTT